MEFSGRSYRNFDKALYKEQLLGCDWETFYDIDNPDKAWEYMLRQFVPILDQMCPTRMFKIKNYRPEWVTNELIEQIKDRDYFYKVAKETGDPDAWNIASHLRNVTNANIRSAKRDFILNELEDNKSDYKKFWKNIRRVMPDSKGDSRREIRLQGDEGDISREEVAQYIKDRHGGLRCDLRCCLYFNNHIT